MVVVVSSSGREREKGRNKRIEEKRIVARKCAERAPAPQSQILLPITQDTSPRTLQCFDTCPLLFPGIENDHALLFHQEKGTTKRIKGE